MFFSKIDNPIGLDLSDLSVKLVQLNRKGPGLELSAYADVSLPGGLLEHDLIQNREALVDYLKRVFSNKDSHKGKFAGRSIVASIPESKAFVRVINLPSLMPEELVTAVPIEAEQYIPLPIGEMQVDWQVVARSDAGLQVFITATPKSYIEELLSVFSDAGLVVQSIEAESAAIVRALLKKSDNPPGTLILDMNASRTSFILYVANSIQFTSSIPMAGNALTDAIAQRLKLNKTEAEKIKRHYGISSYSLPGEKVSPETATTISEVVIALEPVLNNLYDEMKNTIKFYEEHNLSGTSGAVIQEIIICGGTSKLPNLSEYLQGKIQADNEFSRRGIKVSLGDAWRNIIENGPPPFSQREALSYTTALGLALRNYEIS